jgi:small conductance mechanosensitive channel
MNSFVDKVIGTKISQNSVRNLVSQLASAVLILASLYFAMTILKFDDALKAIISAAGISNIVIDLKIKDTLSNTIYGVILSFRNNLNIGNWLKNNWLF